jgi:predicted nucleic acid-binding protein
MIALDTNIIVRLLANDDVSQARRAAEIIRNNEVFVTKTVLLETEWVLRHAYRIDRNTLNNPAGQFPLSTAPRDNPLNLRFSAFLMTKENNA